MTAAPTSLDDELRSLIPRGYALAITILADRQAAEDAVQEAAVNAWRKRSLLRDQNALEPWFLAIVANHCRNARRSRWWTVLKLPDLRGRREDDEQRIAEGLDLANAIGRLAPRDRAALLLHFYMDMTFEQVGAVLDLSMPAARSRVYRSLDRLRAYLEPRVERANG